MQSDEQQIKTATKIYQSENSYKLQIITSTYSWFVLLNIFHIIFKLYIIYVFFSKRTNQFLFSKMNGFS